MKMIYKGHLLLPTWLKIEGRASVNNPALSLSSLLSLLAQYTLYSCWSAFFCATLNNFRENLILACSVSSNIWYIFVTSGKILNSSCFHYSLVFKAVPGELNVNSEIPVFVIISNLTTEVLGIIWNRKIPALRRWAHRYVVWFVPVV